MPRYVGSCHCGRVRFEIDAVIDRVTECNCSICSKKGILHCRVPPENFRLLSGDERADWWEHAVATWSTYASYQEKTDREIPLFLLERK